MSATEPLSASRPSTAALHDIDHCPTCDQAIPPEKLALVKGRLAAHEHQITHELTARLQADFARSREQDRVLSQQALEDARRDAASALAVEREQASAREETARHAARQEADTAHAQQSEAQARQFQQTLAAIQEELKTTEEKRDAAVLDSARVANELAAANDRAADAENRVRQELTGEFEAKAAQKAAEVAAEHARELADTDQRHREAAGAQTAEVARLKTLLESADQTAQLQVEAAQKAASEREAASQAQLVEARSQLETARNEHAAVHEQLRVSRETKDAEVAKAVQETRESVDKAHGAEILALEAKHRDGNQKLIEQFEDTKRRLEQKTAEELGEGAELDLFEELKERFEGDLIRRVPKGTAGVDIVHEVRENGVTCGKIVYDSKNRNDWKTDYATKLRKDQIAENAQHAVLSTNKFPAGHKQLHVVDHVILACPARVLMVAQLMRDQIVQLHTLRASNESREEKTEELYEFMTSSRCTQLFDSMETHITSLEDIDAAESTAHQKVWLKRGKVIKALEKSQGDLRFAVQSIIGGSDNDEGEE